MLSFISIINLINIIITWFSVNSTKILFNSISLFANFLMILVATKFENFSHKELLPSNEELKGN